MVTITYIPERRPSRIQMTQAVELEHSEAKRIKQNLVARGGVNDRDERMLEYMRELRVLSLDHIQRLLWPYNTRKTVYNRLLELSKYYFVSFTRTPRSDMRLKGLHPSRVYSMGQVGWLWLKEDVDDLFTPRYLKLKQVVHDLMVSELFTRMAEFTRKRGKSWELAIVGERRASYFQPGAELPIVSPDGLGVLSQMIEGEQISLPFFVEMDVGREAHGAYSSDWVRKVVGYDRFFDSEWRMHPALVAQKDFPAVLVITHGKLRMMNLARAIAKRRTKPVVYFLARWKEDILPSADIFTDPIWVVVTAQGEVIGQDLKKRKPLMVIDDKKKHKKK